MPQTSLLLLVSHPRSGSDWLRSMLNDHPALCVVDEYLNRVMHPWMHHGAVGSKEAFFAKGMDEQVAILRNALKWVTSPPKSKAKRDFFERRRGRAAPEGGRAFMGFKWFDGQVPLHV